MKAKTVLISGAGIGGPTLAFWLKAGGFEPTLVEHAPAPRAGGFVIDFWGLGYDLAEFMGLARDIERVAYHLRELRIVDDRGERVPGLGTNVFRELTGGRFVTLARSDLSRLLFEKTSGTTEVIFGDEIVDLHENADCVQVQFKHAGERLFDLVIGADGLHSNIRSLVFGSQDRFEKQLGYGVAAFELHGYADGVDPLPAMFGSSAQKALLLERFGNAKWECPRIVAGLDRAQNFYFDRVSQIKMEAWSRGRVALVGDAAFCVSLMAGQGSTLAMTAAYVLAGELAKAAGRHEEAFGKYEMQLRAYIRSKQRGAERFSAAFAPKTRWGLYLRNRMIKACAMPGLARFAFGRDIIDSLQLPKYGWPALAPPTI